MQAPLAHVCLYVCCAESSEAYVCLAAAVPARPVPRCLQTPIPIPGTVLTHSAQPLPGDILFPRQGLRQLCFECLSRPSIRIGLRWGPHSQPCLGPGTPEQGGDSVALTRGKQSGKAWAGGTLAHSPPGHLWAFPEEAKGPRCPPGPPAVVRGRAAPRGAHRGPLTPTPHQCPGPRGHPEPAPASAAR